MVGIYGRVVGRERRRMTGDPRRVALAAGNEGDMDIGERGRILVMGAAVVRLRRRRRAAARCGDDVVCAGGDGGVIVVGVVVVSRSFYHGRRWCCGCGGFGA